MNLLFLTDLKRLLKPDSHSYEGNPITVVMQPPKKKVPLDPVRVHVQGLKAGVTIKPDNVRNYLEKFCDVYVTDVQFGCNNNALVVFDAEPGWYKPQIISTRTFSLSCIKVDTYNHHHLLPYPYLSLKSPDSMPR